MAQVSMNQDVFIWTEAFNCGEILPPMVQSYLAHHAEPLNIFASEKDFEFMQDKIENYTNSLNEFKQDTNISRLLQEI